MRHASKPGQIYFIDVDTVNAGIPYADSFYVTIHFCLTSVSKTADPDYLAGAKDCSRLTLIAAIKYKKTVWGLVKSKPFSSKPFFLFFKKMRGFAAFIEKNTWTGLEDFYANLMRALMDDCEESKKTPGKSKKKNKAGGVKRRNVAGDIGNGQALECAEDDRVIADGLRKGEFYSFFTTKLCFDLQLFDSFCGTTRTE